MYGCAIIKRTEVELLHLYSFSQNLESQVSLRKKGISCRKICTRSLLTHATLSRQCHSFVGFLSFSITFWWEEYIKSLFFFCTYKSVEIVEALIRHKLFYPTYKETTYSITMQMLSRFRMRFFTCLNLNGWVRILKTDFKVWKQNLKKSACFLFEFNIWIVVWFFLTYHI